VARLYAGILGTLALLTALARTLLHGGDPVAGVAAACGWMAAAAAVGGVLGHLAERTVDEAVAARLMAEMDAQQAQRNPAPVRGS
jgi:hypothetical protein